MPATSSPADTTRSAPSPCVSSRSTRRRPSTPHGGSTASAWRSTCAVPSVWSNRPETDRLLPPRTRRRRRAPRAGHRHIRPHGGRAVPLGGHVPSTPRHRRGPARGLRRPARGHLRQSSQTLPHKAGLNAVDGYLWGASDRKAHVVHEHGRQFLVNWEEGQKTGFFLDQRENRELVMRYAAGRTVLNTFCYTGGFSVYALAGGAREVCSVDSSERAVHLADAERAPQLRRRRAPHGRGGRCRGVPEEHRRPLRPDHPRPARLRQAPQGAGQRHAGVQAAQCPGPRTDQERRHSFHVLVLAGRVEGTVPHDGLPRPQPSRAARCASCTS